MARTPSNMIPLGTKAPNFSLLNTVSGKKMTLQELKGKRGTVLFFICNHCPFVIHINPSLVRFANEFMNAEISFVAISSNDIVNYPQDSPENMQRVAKELNYPFPYLYDETQDVARAYDAACTPDFYLFDSEMKLVYRGQYDDSRPGNGKEVTGNDLRIAIECLLEGKENTEVQKPSIGCNIKWKS